MRKFRILRRLVMGLGLGAAASLVGSASLSHPPSGVSVSRALAQTCTVITPVFTGDSEYFGGSGAGAIKSNISTNAPSGLCNPPNPQYDYYMYFWNGMTGNSADCQALVQVGWGASPLNPTPRYFAEEFNIYSPCPSGIIWPSGSPNGLTHTYETAIVPGIPAGRCATHTAAKMYIDGSQVAFVCDDWGVNGGSNGINTAESYIYEDMVASNTFDSYSYCSPIGSGECTPNTAFYNTCTNIQGCTGPQNSNGCMKQIEYDGVHYKGANVYDKRTSGSC